MLSSFVFTLSDMYSDVDCSFFLVTVDLWSEDGKQEMNLVLHPSSGDRFVPVHTTKTRRRGTSSSTPHPRSSGNQTPISQSTPSVQFRSGDQVCALFAMELILTVLTLLVTGRCDHYPVYATSGYRLQRTSLLPSYGR